MEEYNFKINKKDVDKRLDVFLVENLNDLSRKIIQDFIKRNNIQVNNLNKKSSYKLLEDDLITCKIENIDLKIEKENIPLNIVYEDNDIVILNKEKNMVVHLGSGNLNGTLVNGLKNKYGENLSNINGELRPGIVHRLDKDTSGVLVIAKNNQSHLELAKQFKEGTVLREYTGLVFGQVKDLKGIINKPIGRDEKKRIRMSINYNSGKNAITEYEVLEYSQQYTLLKLNLKTGRTHQIRVHMDSIGHSVVGDKLYGNIKQKFRSNGQLLHAKKIGFIHPTTKKYMEFETELPEYFQKVLKILDLNKI